MSNIISLAALRKAKSDDISILAGFLLEAFDRIEELEMIIAEMSNDKSE